MGDLGAEPRLVVPEGLMIDESARDRLERQLALAPAAVAGVAAETSELAPGSSYRVHAEWQSLEPRRSTPSGTANRVRGAVLLRLDAGYEVRDGVVEIADGSVLVDTGAHVHDPYGPIGPLQNAVERGCPPFPRRPVVVFLGCEGGTDTDWLRRLVNRLVRRDVEARIALPDVVGGLHLTRPCLPTEASVRTLSPDVVVTLDATAAAQVHGWCAGNRSTVVVEYDRELSVPMELVSWQIGRAQGRLRARIGPHVDVPAFASLVVRLCAGPHPIPPEDDDLPTRVPVRERRTAAAEDERLGCMVITGVLSPAAHARVEGLVDNLEAAHVPVARVAVAGNLPPESRRAALVLLVGVAPAPEINELITHRHRAGLPIAVDLGRDDLEPAATASDARPRLTDPSAALAAACGLAVSPAGAVHAAIRELVARGRGLRALALPTLLTPADAAASRDARATPDPAAPLVVGWHLGAAGAPSPDYAEAVAAALATILSKRPDSVELVGDPARVPAALRGHERVTIVSEADFDPAVIAGWAVHVWTPALVAGQVVDDARQFEAVSYTGVASVMPSAADEVVDGLVSRSVLVQSVDRAEEWAEALHHMLDDAARRGGRTREALRRADAVDSPAMSKAVVGRLMGWARYRERVDA